MSKSSSKANHTVFHSKQTAPPLALHHLIAQQTAAFLADGGEIQSIPRGVSGQAKLSGPNPPPASAPKT